MKRRRTPVEKHRRIGSESVTMVALGEKSDDRQVIAENAHAAFRAAAALRQRRHRIGSFADGSENIQFDRGFECGRVLISIERIEYESRIRLCSAGLCGHRFSSL